MAIFANKSKSVQFLKINVSLYIQCILKPSIAKTIYNLKKDVPLFANTKKRQYEKIGNFDISKLSTISNKITNCAFIHVQN